MFRLAAVIAICALTLLACGSADDDGRAARSAGTGTAGDRATPGGEAQLAASAVRLVPVGRFNGPLYVTAPPGDRRRVMVVEQRGVIRVLRGGRRLSRPFLDIRNKVTSGGEQGLLGLAFAPDYRSTGRFYVYYTDRSANQRVVEYRRASADRARAGSARTVLVMRDDEGNHNGGDIKFGPDRLLYIATGDGGGGGDQHGSRGNAQSLGSLLGKLLRIDPRASGTRRYRIPASNPFTGDSGRRAEIYSYGLRNPWRCSFDRATGDVDDRRRRGELGRGGQLRPPRACSRRELRLAAVGGTQALHSRGRAIGGIPRDTEIAQRRLVFDHRRLCGARPGAEGAEGPLRVWRLLQGPAAQRQALGRPRDGRPLAGASERGQPLLIRRGRPRSRLRDLARRTGLPVGGPLSRPLVSRRS